MTYKQKMISLLIQKGMPFDDATDVLDVAMKDKCLEGMERGWNDDIDSCPEIMVGVVYLNVESIARDWIEENKPNAWFKPLFQVGSE